MNIPSLRAWSQSISLFIQQDPVELSRYTNTITMINLALEVKGGGDNLASALQEVPCNSSPWHFHAKGDRNDDLTSMAHKN